MVLSSTLTFVYPTHFSRSFPAVILYYDYILTFRDEYNLYWTSKTRFSFATVLFYLNRYATILGHIPMLALGFGSWFHTDRLQT
ncbi:hypothetical protein CVT25_008112 [Psilocybe cyanescens]|uniref:DUF6533 domain-containing protein n=1 Tax=Psilocybe cyanescens TaxID=93625 RepID=A0A409X9H3_PSICY|nr:hypothetical protein CVT25_008112 [Psilocybe cyanescens]